MEFLYIILGAGLIFGIISYVFGTYGPKDRVLGLNIKSELKKKGFAVYATENSVWLEIGSQAEELSNRIINERKEGKPIDLY